MLLNSLIIGVFNYLLPFSVLCLVLAGVFIQGLFFEPAMSIHQYLVAVFSTMISIAILLSCFVSNNTFGCYDNDVKHRLHCSIVINIRDFVSPYFFSLCLLTVVYFLSFVQAVNYREALVAGLRYIDYLLVFIMATIAVKNTQLHMGQYSFIDLSLRGIALVGMLVGLLGILTGQGFFSINGNIFEGRLGSVFQYPNTMAAYLMATLIITLFNATEASRPWLSGLYSTMAFIMALAITLSQSRGVLIILPIMILLLYLGTLFREKMVGLLVGILIGVVLLSPWILPGQDPAGPDWIAFLLLVLGAFISFIWGVGVTKFTKSHSFIENRVYDKSEGEKETQNLNQNPDTRSLLKGKQSFVLAIILLIIMAGYCFASIKGISPDSQILENSSMYAQTERSTLKERLFIYADANKMILDRPLLGWGGGGWISAYHYYQSYLYNASDVHNHFLQVSIETGIIGLLAYLLAYLGLGYGMIKIIQLRIPSPKFTQSWAVGVAALSLGLHSGIDFDFSYSSVFLLFWFLLALFNNKEHKKTAISGSRLSPNHCKDYHIHSLKGNVGQTSMALLIIMLAFILYSTTFNLREASIQASNIKTLVQNGQFATAAQRMPDLQGLRRWDTGDIVDLSVLLLVARENNQDNKEQLYTSSMLLARQAIELDRYNSRNHFFLANIYLKNGQLANAVREAETGLHYQPWDIKAYEELARVYLNVAFQYFISGQKPESEKYLSKAEAVPEIALERENNLASKYKKQRSSKNPGLTLTPDLNFVLGQVAFMQGDYSRALVFFNRAEKEGNTQDTDPVLIWKALALQKLGDPVGIELENSLIEAEPEIKTEFVTLHSLLD